MMHEQRGEAARRRAKPNLRSRRIERIAAAAGAPDPGSRP
jgi:hypothetical protein